MSVIFVEGFTGYPREAAATSLTSSLLAGGYLLPTAVNAGTPTYPAGSGYSIVADPIFADRNILRFLPQSTTSQIEQALTWNYNLAANPAKVVLGFTLLVNIHQPAAKSNWQVMIGSPNMSVVPATGLPRGTALMTEAFATLDFNNSVVAAPNAAILVPGNSTSPAATQFTSAVTHHCELFLESDVNRVRLYLDGVLVADGPFNGNLPLMNAGFSIHSNKKVAGANNWVDIGNIYTLAIDSVHTGPLGPAARVIEIAPTADVQAQWARDEAKFASNAAVAGQLFTQVNDFLTAMDVGTTDLYAGPPGIAGNAAQIFGVGIKVAAKSLTDNTHAMKTTVRMNGVSLDSSEFALPLQTNSTTVRDASINPATNAIWKPAEVSAGQFGYKLSK